MIFSIKTSYKSQPYRYDVYEGGFENLDTNKITQVYSVVYNDSNEVLLVHNKKIDAWGLIGGTVEKGETLIECLERECQEEGAITIQKDSLKPLFYQEVYKIIDGAQEFESYQIRYLVKIQDCFEFKGDPDGSIDKIKWVSIDNVHKYLKWPKTSEFIVEKLKLFFTKS